MREVFVTTPTKPHHRALLEQAAAGRCRLTFGTDGIERADAVIGAVEAMTGCSVEAVNIHVGGVTLA